MLQLGNEVGADAASDFVKPNQRRSADDLQDSIVDLVRGGGRPHASRSARRPGPAQARERRPPSRTRGGKVHLFGHIRTTQRRDRGPDRERSLWCAWFLVPIPPLLQG